VTETVSGQPASPETASSQPAGTHTASAETASSWMDRLAMKIERDAASGPPGQTLVCASGISPSGPIHMGNLREVFTTHLVVEALRARGHSAVHLHSWDDYDRLRKVPAGVDPSFAEHIGKPLAAVPDPAGQLGSYADHFIAEFSAALDALGIEVHGVRQSQRYPRGDYNAAIRRAMDERALIFDTLAAQQTAGRHDRPVEERRRDYYPFKPYCAACGTDNTQVDGYAGESVSYHCRCGHRGSMSLADGVAISGKLVWKVDWPMRWAHEHVVFEPAGEDHHAPTGSFTVGSQLVRSIFGGTPPRSAVYSFVTMAGGNGKMSSSAGGAAVPATALDVIEPTIMRWLYARRLPSQSFAIDLGPSAVQRLYDEWDRFAQRAVGPHADPSDSDVLASCLRTSAGEVRATPRPVSFRLLASAADITQGNTTQIARIVAEHLAPAEPVTGAAEPPSAAELIPQLRPRLDCAINWATRLLPSAQRTVIRDSFNSEQWEQLDSSARESVRTLVAGLAGSWTLDGLTALVYAVPKLMLGLPADAPPTGDLKKAQREFFKVLYELLCSADTGPRLPTLLLSIGLDRTTALLAGNGA
jgi:lysyl-tRNA synthetase, class I